MPLHTTENSRLMRTGHIFNSLLNELQQRIRNGEWQPGSHLPSITHLAHTFGVSTGSGREALRSPDGRPRDRRAIDRVARAARQPRQPRLPRRPKRGRRRARCHARALRGRDCRPRNGALGRASSSRSDMGLRRGLGAALSRRHTTRGTCVLHHQARPGRRSRECRNYGQA